MSLTRLIKAGRGPVWGWFAENFPATQRVCTDANRQLRGGPSDEPCAVAPPQGADLALVGTAVGYIVSAHLRADALDRTVATAGARMLDGPLRGGIVRPSVIERQAVLRIAELRSWERPLTGAEWIEVTRLACILARFEQFARAGGVILPHLEEPLRVAAGDLAELAQALASKPTLADAAQLGRCAVEDHAHIRDAHELHIGPTFQVSGLLGGADADLIYDGTLLDLKATASSAVLKRRALWQGLGYLLADSDDRYRIHTVGFSAIRRRRSVFWPAQQFIDLLAGRPSASVKTWRDEFRAMLADKVEAPRARLIERKASL